MCFCKALPNLLQQYKLQRRCKSRFLTLLVIPEIVPNCIVSAEKKRQLMSTFSKDKTLYDFRIQIDSSDIRIPNKQTPKEDNKSFEKEKASLVAAIADEKKRCSDMRTDYENKLAELTKRLEESEKRRNETPKESRFANPQLIDFLHRCSDIWTAKNTPGRTVNEIEDAILSLRNSYFMLRKRIPEIEGLSQLDLNIIGATSFCSQRLKQLRNCCEDWVGILVFLLCLENMCQCINSART